MLLFTLALLLATAAFVYASRSWFHAGDHNAFAQTAAAIIFGVPNAFLAVGVVVMSIRATAASEAQAEAAREQIEVARAQSTLAKLQLKEAVRPVLDIRRGEFTEHATFDSDLPPLMMRNLGAGTACRLIVTRFQRNSFHGREITSTLPMMGTVLPPGQSFNLPKFPENEEAESDNVMIFYESISGHRYCSTYYGEDEQPVLNYEDDPFTWPQ